MITSTKKRVSSSRARRRTLLQGFDSLSSSEKKQHENIRLYSMKLGASSSVDQRSQPRPNKTASQSMRARNSTE